MLPSSSVNQPLVFVWSPPLITTHVIVANLRAQGFTPEVVDGVCSLERNMNEESRPFIVVADMLTATEEEQLALRRLVESVFLSHNRRNETELSFCLCQYAEIFWFGPNRESWQSNSIIAHEWSSENADETS
jgi:hypothetical protein